MHRVDRCNGYLRQDRQPSLHIASTIRWGYIKWATIKPNCIFIQASESSQARLTTHMSGRGEDKRAVLTLQLGDHGDWLHTSNSDAARATLKPWPAEYMVAGPVD